MAPKTDVIEQLRARIAELERAEATLIKAGYTDCGGELWKPPLGESAFPLLDRIAELEVEVERLNVAHVKACQANADSQAELAKAEQRVAEACALQVATETKFHWLDAARVAKEIRSGEWRKFVKEV